MVTLAENPVYGASGNLPETNLRDKSYQRSMSDFRPSTLAGRRKSYGGKRNSVTFNPEIVVHLIPYEDRRSEWMQYAKDRAHFRRRVQLFEELFTSL